MRGPIRYFFIMALLLVIGYICIHFYNKFVSTVYEIPLYIGAMASTTIALNRLTIWFERQFRPADELRAPFARTLYFLVPCIFMFYQFYLVQSFELKLVLGILIMIFTFFSVYAFSAALGHTSLARRRINVVYGVLLISALFILASLLIHSTGVMLLMPLTLMILYTDYLRFNFFDNYSRQHYSRTIMATGFFSIVFMILLMINQITDDTAATMYNTAIGLYIALLTIVAGFTVYFLTQRQRGFFHVVARTALVGLAQFYLIITGVAVVGRLMGTELDGSIFASGTTLGAVFGDPISVLVFFRVLMLYFAIASFPFALIYLYATIRDFLS